MERSTYSKNFSSNIITGIFHTAKDRLHSRGVLDSEQLYPYQ